MKNSPEMAHMELTAHDLAKKGIERANQTRYTIPTYTGGGSEHEFHGDNEITDTVSEKPKIRPNNDLSE